MDLISSVKRPALGLLVAAVVSGLTACGGAGTSAPASNSAIRVAARTDLIVHRVLRAIASLHSYRVAGIETNSTGTVSAHGEVAGPGRMLMVERRGPLSFEIVTLGTETYIKASRSFLATLPNLAPGLVGTLAGRWLEAPTASVPGLQANVSRTTNLGLDVLQCARSHKTTLTDTGVGTLGGRAVVILTNSGTTPGSAPGRLYVAATGPAWPLRILTTGPRRPGGPSACATPGEDTVAALDLTLSDFNQPIDISAPKHALDLLRMTASASQA